MVSAQISPMVATCVNGYPCRWDWTSQFPSIHEMTSVWCVIAFLQTETAWDLSSSSYRNYGGASNLHDAQYNILHAVTGGSDNLTAVDVPGLAWVNAQFAGYGYYFRYDQTLPATTAQFMGWVRLDVYHYVEANYVRVDLSIGGYGGWRGGYGGLHSTGTTGYDDNAGTVTSYDPFSTRGSNGYCSSNSYGGTGQTQGCFWTMPQGRYFGTIDTNTNNGTLPIWW